MEFPIDGTAALVAVPFRPIRPDSGQLRALLGAGGPDAAELGELVQRLEEVVRWLRVREADHRQEAVVRFGEIEVEPVTQNIRRRGVPVPVTRIEFRLLYALMRRPGQVVSRDALFAEVWGAGVRLRSRAIDTHIARLRRKLEVDPAAPRHIRTAPYLGYRFDPRGG